MSWHTTSSASISRSMNFQRENHPVILIATKLRMILWMNLFQFSISVCGCWPPRWPQMISTFWFSNSGTVSSHVAPKLVCATNSLQQNWWYIPFKMRLKKRLQLLFRVFSHIHALSILGHLLWGKQAAMLWTSLWRGPQSEGPKPLANSRKGAGTCQQTCEWVWKQIFQSQPRSELTAALANSLTPTSWETLSQKFS